MIEFHERAFGRASWHVIGMLLIDDQHNTYTVLGRLPLDDLPILDSRAFGGRLWLRDDPRGWAQNCHRVFDNGYVIAVRVDGSGH